MQEFKIDMDRIIGHDDQGEPILSPTVAATITADNETLGLTTPDGKTWYCLQDDLKDVLAGHQPETKAEDINRLPERQEAAKQAALSLGLAANAPGMKIGFRPGPELHAILGGQPIGQLDPITLAAAERFIAAQ